jgi:putative membrane protein
MLIRKAALALGLAGMFLVPATAAQAAPSDQDAAYLRAAHQSNLAEIAGGKLAQQKGDSQDVKDLGARFVADHTKLDAAVRQTASQLDVDLPGAPNEEQQALAAKYQQASGDDFDALFVSTQMDAHMKAMANGQKEISQGSDAAAKKNAQAAAPVIASHHELLNDAARAVGVPAGIGTGTGGEAAGRTFTTPVVALLSLGVLLLVAGAVLFRRRLFVRA